MKRRTETILWMIFLSCAVVVAAADVPQPAAGVAGTVPGGSGTRAVLYDQTDNAGGNGAPDQDFEAGFDTYDSRGADDFEVPSNYFWDISQVQTVGTTGTPGSATVSVWFFADASGSPGTQVCSYTGLTPVDNAGSLTIDLPTPCRTEGRTWVAIQVQQDWGAVGQHFWSNRTVQSFSPSQWENPGNGFGTGCTTWGAQAGTLDGNPATGCGVGGGVNPDFLYTLIGTQEAQRQVPTLGSTGVVAMILLLVAGALAVLLRRS